MKKNYGLLPLGIVAVLFFHGCGKESPLVSSSEETCATSGCTEKELNAPVGPQPEEEPLVPYDSVAGNPARDSLRFPPFRSSWGLKRAIYEKAVRYYEKNRTSISNPRYFSIVDFNLHSTDRRFFLFDLGNGSVERHNVAAGKNSDQDNDGYATRFSNQEGSLMSSLGFYRTLRTYNGTHGLSLRLDGLDSSNDNALARAVVMHPADYVSDRGQRAGRSWGCPAIDPAISQGVIERLKNGSILLIDR